MNPPSDSLNPEEDPQNKRTFINEKGMKITRILKEDVDQNQTEIIFFNWRIEKIENLEDCKNLKVKLKETGFAKKLDKKNRRLGQLD